MYYIIIDSHATIIYSHATTVSTGGPPLAKCREKCYYLEEIPWEGKEEGRPTLPKNNPIQISSTFSRDFILAQLPKDVHLWNIQLKIGKSTLFPETSNT